MTAQRTYPPEDARWAWFVRGMRDGIPIFLGYAAVSFSLGIICRQAGMGALLATLMSFSNNTSAGEFAAVGLMAAGAPLWDMALTQLVVNIRYVLMSAAMSQKLRPETTLWERLVVAFEVTDEVFGVSIGVPGRLSAWYPMGLMAVAIPGWSLGTWAGVVMGNILPESIVAALSVALYGMFIAVIIPPARADRNILLLIVASMAASLAATLVPATAALSSGSRICLLTVVISALAATFLPAPGDAQDKAGEGQA